MNLSQSAVKTWEAATQTTPEGVNHYHSPACKHYWKLIYIDGNETPPSDAQLLGQVFEYKLTGQKTLHGQTPELPKLKNGGASADERMIDERVEATKAFLEHHGIVLRNGSVFIKDGITGHIDAESEVNGKPAIIDIKFTETKEDDKWHGWGDMDKIDLLQPATYVWGMGTPYRRFYYLIVGKTWLRLVQVLLTQADLEDMHTRFAAVREAIAQADFSPTPTWKNCKSCKLADICQHSVKFPEIETYQRG
jgi:CRISPR/Cas system-associated exonuclease Cas4 (RecB family)